MDRRGWGAFIYSGNKKLAGNGQRPSGIEEDFVGRQGTERAVVREVGEGEEEEEEVGEEEEDDIEQQ